MELPQVEDPSESKTAPKNRVGGGTGKKGVPVYGCPDEKRRNSQTGKTQRQGKGKRKTVHA